MDPCNAILDCLGLGRTTHYDEIEEQPAHGFPHERKQSIQTAQSLGFPHEKKQHVQTTQSLADDILSTLYAADANDEHLVLRLQEVVRETGWYESLVATVLNALEYAIKVGVPMVGQAMKDAYERAAQAAGDVWGFAKEHPVFCAVVALGILVILAPWAIEVLGFGELGPIEGM
jgi:hypothetical protein